MNTYRLGQRGTGLNLGVSFEFIMPRSERLNAPGIVRHVIIREIECEKIFKDSQPEVPLVNLDKVIS